MESLINRGLKLTEDEAFALLGLCLTSPGPVDEVASEAMRKLAAYCSQRGEKISNHQVNLTKAATIVR